MIELIHGDCLEEMKNIPDGSVDMILTDPPYGTMLGAELDGWEEEDTKWDKPIDHEKMLSGCNRVLRTNGVLLLFSQDPYTAKLMTKTHGNLPFSYRLTWLKDHFANALIAKKAPVNYTEDICVFFKKYDTLKQHPLRGYTIALFKYIGKDKKTLFSEMKHQGVCHFMRHNSMQFMLCTENTYNELIDMYNIDKIDCFLSYDEMTLINKQFSKRFNLLGKNFKSNVLQYKKDYQGLHPTQKPLALKEDLIKTYSNESDTVLDFTMGSGTTGVACKNLNRDFIGIELDENYFNIAKNRIEGC